MEIWPKIENQWTALDKDTFFEVLNFCLDNGYFRYNSKVYAQIQGTAMGSPLSAIVSELVLDVLFEALKENFRRASYTCILVATCSESWRRQRCVECDSDDGEFVSR